MTKTAPKTAQNRYGCEIPLGAHPGNTGGKKGRSGRKPMAITLAAQQAIDEHDLIGMLAKIAQYADKTSDRIAAIRLLLDRGYGQAPQRIEHTGEDGGPIEIVTEAKREFQSRVDSLVTRLGAAALPEWPE